MSRCHSLDGYLMCQQLKETVMNKSRRAFLAAAASSPLLAVSQTGPGAGFPNRTVTLVVPFGPGSTPDVVARVLGQKLSAAWGQAVIVENKPGASGQIGTEAVVRAEADGHTILVTTSTFVIAPSLYAKPRYDPLREFAAVSFLGTSPMILVTRPEGSKSVAELIAAARQRPASIAYGSTGIGTPHHLAMALLEDVAKVNLVHVPYKAPGELVTGLLSDQVNAAWLPIAVALPHVQAGKLVALANSKTQRSRSLPEVQTMQELGFAGYEVDNWVGAVVPARTPVETLLAIERAIAAALSASDVQEKLGATGLTLEVQPGSQFARRLASEQASWGRLLRERKINIE